MNSLTVFADPLLGENAAAILREGTAGHTLLFPAKPASSVLGQAEPDPAFARAEVAFGQPHLECIRSAENLKWLQISSAGFTRYDTPEFRQYVAERGIVVTNSSDVYAQACAEHVFSFMLANARMLPQALASRAPNGSPEWLGLRAGSRSLHGQSVVILGYGVIARHLVKLLAPFEMKITAMRRQPRGDEGLPVVTARDLPAALAAADHVIDILPDNAASRGFVNDALFSAMKTGAVFHNIGRGTTVDQDALLRALRSGKLSAAWLDVTEPEPLPDDHPLRLEEHCFITPHIAGGHHAEDETLVRHFVENFRRFLVGEPLVDRVM
jgi:phosphoglycerate dehydrogenase-like enzyme